MSHFARSRDEQSEGRWLKSSRPDVWRAAHPESIRTYCAEARRDRADRKQARRATG